MTSRNLISTQIGVITTDGASNMDAMIQDFDTLLHQRDFTVPFDFMEDHAM